MTDQQSQSSRKAHDYNRKWVRRLTLYNTPSRMVVWYDEGLPNIPFELEAKWWPGGYRDVIGKCKRPK